MKILFLNPPDINKISENTVDEKSQEYIESDDFGAFPLSHCPLDLSS